MNDALITLVGNIATDVTPVLGLDKGTPLATFRVASSARHFDKESGTWQTTNTIFANVACWRTMAEHVQACLKKGDAVVVHGRLRQRKWETREGQPRQDLEIEALAVGLDLGRVPAVRAQMARADQQPADSAGGTAGSPGDGHGVDKGDVGASSGEDSGAVAADAAPSSGGRSGAVEEVTAAAS